ncbi:MAG: sulfite exporter TauE/SafE family protein [Patescibacteria group bacterium]|jgi:sulfite exporter TauE/SafE/copper chaperone CopZ|nr:sulfite exporter TauE/SafE family protein [Patescibacteria group bacterium]
MSENKILKVKVSGLHCKACELLSEEKLSALPGVKKVRVSHSRGQAEIEYQGEIPDKQSIQKELQLLGYDLEENTKTEDKNKKIKELVYALLITLTIAIILWFSGWLNLADQLNPETMSWGAVLLIGLIAGVSTCMALVGGIVMALATDYARRHPQANRVQKFLPHIFFNLGRVIGFFILGGLLGSLGSIFKISITFNAWLTIIIAFIIIFLGLQILDIFPKIQRFSITLPKSLSRFVPTHTKNRKYRPLAAFSAGALSFFLPCGFTQSMQIYALASGSFFSGAIIMAIFALGTAPGFLSLGALVSVFKGRNNGTFFKSAGLIIILFGLFNFNNAYKILRLQAASDNSISTQEINQTKDMQIIRMEQASRGYIPNRLQVEVNKPVRWIITSTNPYSCASSLVVPSLKINQQLKEGENIIEFTPLKIGEIRFSCSMGMYSGVIEVLTPNSSINNNLNNTNQTESPVVESTCSLKGCF